MMTLSGSMPSRFEDERGGRLRRSDFCHQSRTSAKRLAGDGEAVFVEQAQLAQVEHDFGDATGEEDLDSGMTDGAVGERIDEARDFAVGAMPVVSRGTAQARGVGDGGDVQEEVGRAAEGGVDDHGVLHGFIGEDVWELVISRFPCSTQGRGRSGWPCRARWVGRRGRGPSAGATGRGASADDLAGGGGAHELAAAAGGGAGAAAGLGGFFEGHQTVGEAGADGLDLTGVLAVLWREGDAAGDEDRGEVVHSGEGQHHRREALVAGGHAHDSAAARQGANKAAEDDGGVVAEGEGVHHAGGALGAAIAGVGAEAGEGDERSGG